MQRITTHVIFYGFKYVTLLRITLVAIVYERNIFYLTDNDLSYYNQRNIRIFEPYTIIS